MNKNYILGVFKDEESLVSAFEKVKEKGILPRSEERRVGK